MKREEAINLLGWLKSKTNRDDDLEAIDMAIEAMRTDIVFCKDCKKRGAFGPKTFCALYACSVPDEHYCSYGERGEP